jgi:hypothetical protein
MRRFTLIILWLALPALGGEVLRVGSSQQILAVSQDEQKPWRVGDRLCVFEDRQEIECGEVTKSNGKMAIVKLDAPNDRVFQGARVKTESTKTTNNRYGRSVPPQERRDGRDNIDEPEELLAPPPNGDGDRKGRRPAAKLLSSYEKVEGVSNPDWNFSFGISAGFTFFFPMVHFQRRLSTYVALGIMPVYFRSSASTTSVGAYGGVLTFNYYGNEYFRGFWGQFGAGMYQFSAANATTTESATSLSLMGTVGWRGYWDLGLNVGVGAGLQYVTDPQFTTTDIRAVNVQPLIVLDVGISF